METVYFISDLHLKSMQEDKAQILLRFFISLQAEAAKTQLFLVGDIFDLWLGSHAYFAKKFKPLLAELKKLVQAGAKVYYFEGNHDLHLTAFYEWGMGIQVFKEAEVFQLQGQTVRVEHGDQMDPEDKGYLFLRWLLRTGASQALILNLPGAVVAKVGDIASKTSRNYTDHKRDTDRILKTIHAHALKIHSEKPFDALIAGHVHLRDEYHFQNNGQKAISFNLGSWDEEPMVLALQQGQWSWKHLS